MVQLTLMETVPGQTLAAELAELSGRWSGMLQDVGHVDAAAQVTRRTFHSWEGKTLSAHERRRVHAYFQAVLRRRITHSADPSAIAARRRLLASVIEQDLVSAGWDARRAADEASRVTGIGARLTSDVA